MRKTAPEWELRLYVTGHGSRSLAARHHLRKICKEHLEGRYTIEVIDVLKSPHLARRDKVAAVPTLVRRHPRPIKRIVGDLSNTPRVLAALGIRTVRKRRAPSDRL
jgi:circadian clock protein KaiB